MVGYACIAIVSVCTVASIWLQQASEGELEGKLEAANQRLEDLKDEAVQAKLARLEAKEREANAARLLAMVRKSSRSTPA